MSNDAQAIQQQGRSLPVSQKTQGPQEKSNESSLGASKEKSGIQNPLTVFIYALCDPITKQIRYVGKAIDIRKRMYSHMHQKRNRNIHKDCWIRHLLACGLRPEVEILQEIHNSDDKDWQIEERWWISYLRFIGCPLTNLDNGGWGGRKACLETRAKLSAAKKGFTLSPEARAKIGNAHRGRKRSPEAIAAMIAKNTGQKRTPEQIAKMRASRGPVIISPETRAKISATLKGRKIPPEIVRLSAERLREALAKPEARARHAAASTGRKQSPETIAKRMEKLKGFKHSPESLKKMSLIQSTRVRNPHSEQARKNMSIAAKKKPMTQEWLARLREMGRKNASKPITEETRRKLSISHKLAWEKRKGLTPK